MQYRRFGNLDWRVSALGFGGSHLPTLDGVRGAVDEPQAVRLLRYAIDHGVNYIETGRPYDRGMSEAAIGKALQGGYREKVKVTAKLPIAGIETPDDCDRFLDRQLERLQMDSIDFYVLHGLERGQAASSWSRVKERGVLDWAERAMAEGRFHHLGFSHHGSFDAFREIVDEYAGWALCTIPFNFMDEEYQAGRRGLEYAAQRGLAVAVMEPLQGGRLAARCPPTIQALWDSAIKQRAPADWALLWVLDHPQVSVAVSGMSTLEQVRQNIASASRSGPAVLTEEEVALIGRVRNRYQALATARCSDYGCYIPCPNDVDIPRVLASFNAAIRFDGLFGGHPRDDGRPKEQERCEG
jgi:predicted aldo/keto reductase-like oxidoreductase